jgi:hypothetical protein
MAIALFILGSILGFIGGLFAYFVLGSALFTALSIWALSGPVIAALVMLRPSRVAERLATA